MKKGNWLLLLGTLLTLTSQSQSWQQVSIRSFREDISSFSFDDRGAIYVGTITGLVTKIDKDGTEDTFAYPNSGVLTLIEGRNPLLPFLFFRDNQQAIVLDRFLSNPVVYDINTFAGGFAWLATPAIDRHIWLLKNSPLSILKVDPINGSVVQSTPLLVDFPLEEVVYFKAQRNLLLVVDAKYGVLVFDLFGNPVLSLKQRGLQFAHIDGSELIAYANGMILTKLLTAEAETQSLPAPEGSFHAVIKRRDRFYFVSEREVRAFTLGEE